MSLSPQHMIWGQSSCKIPESWKPWRAMERETLKWLLGFERAPGINWPCPGTLLMTMASKCSKPWASILKKNWIANDCLVVMGKMNVLHRRNSVNEIVSAQGKNALQLNRWLKKNVDKELQFTRFLTVFTRYSHLHSTGLGKKQEQSTKQLLMMTYPTLNKCINTSASEIQIYRDPYKQWRRRRRGQRLVKLNFPGCLWL